MKTASTAYEKEVSPLSSLSGLQKHFLNLSAQLGVEGDALAGTFLLLKDNQEEMEDMLLWMYDNHPSKEEIHQELVRVVKARGTSQESSTGM